MRWLLHRKLVTPVLVVLAALIALSGEPERGTWFAGAALAYWRGAEWYARLRARPRRSGTGQRTDVVRVAVQTLPSDGLNGAIGRLDPGLRDWIIAEGRAQRGEQHPR